jgi:hypothetical protein
MRDLINENTDVDGFNLAILPRLRTEVQKHIGDAGKIEELVAYAEAKGGGWVATLDTEYAALKLFYAYRHSGARMTKSVVFGATSLSYRVSVRQVAS